MTVSTTINRISYSGNGATTDFSFPYLFYKEEHLKVYIVNDTTNVSTLQTLTTHYTTTGEGVDAGGTVTMITPPATGETLLLLRSVPLTQLIDYISGGSFPSETHEQGLDLLTMIAQQIKADSDRALKVGIEFPLPNDIEVEANRVIGFDQNGDIKLYDPSEAGISAIIPTATAVPAGTTVVTVPAYEPNIGVVLWFLESNIQIVGTDITETNSTTVTLASAAVTDSTLYGFSFTAKDIGTAAASNVSDDTAGTTIQVTVDDLKDRAPEVTEAQFDTDSTAGNTRLLVWDVDTGALARVSVGAADSGGTGYKVLRIPN